MYYLQYIIIKKIKIYIYIYIYIYKYEHVYARYNSFPIQQRANKYLSFNNHGISYRSHIYNIWFSIAIL